MEGEDMDSLFEGMVLFNPAQIEDKNRIDNDSESDAHASAVSCSQPLDENIFSDLTLVLDPLQNSEADQSRQHASSRRRKRSGLRIGYGRDTADVDLPSPLPHIDDAGIDVAATAAPTASEPITDDDDDAAAAAAVSVIHPPSRSAAESVDNVDETFSEASFRQIKATINEKLINARQLVNSASAVRKGAIRRRRKAVENENLASLKYMELEKQLEEACEAEDFERAEKISEHLSAAEKEKQIFASSLREADAFVDDLDLKLQHALHSHIAAEEECAILLHHFATVSEKTPNNVELHFLHLLLILFNRRVLVYPYLKHTCTFSYLNENVKNVTLHHWV